MSTTIKELAEQSVDNFYPLLNKLMEFMNIEEALTMTINVLHYMPGQLDAQDLARAVPSDVSEEEIRTLIAKYAEQRAESKRQWEIMESHADDYWY